MQALSFIQSLNALSVVPALCPALSSGGVRSRREGRGQFATGIATLHQIQALGCPGIPRNVWEDTESGAHPQFLIQQVWRGAPSFVFLVNFQVLLVLPA